MTDDVTKVDDQFKAQQLSNPAKLLRAYMKCSGVFDAKQIAADLGIPVRTIQRLKLDIACATDGAATSANYAMGGVYESASCAMDGVEETPKAPHVASLARVEDNNINTNPIIEIVEVIPPVVPQAAKPAEPKRRKGTFLPDDFEMPDDWAAWTRTNCPTSTPERLHVEALKFANHFQSKAGAAGRKVNWFKTWQNWCLTAFGTSPARPTAAQAVDWREAKRENDRQFLREVGLMP